MDHTDAQKFKFLLWAPAIVGVSLILGLWILGSSIASSRQDDTITVTGSVKKSVTSDLAKWNGTVLHFGKAPELKGAIAAVNVDIEKVKKFISSAGIDVKTVKVKPLDTTIVYEQLPGGYYGQSQTISGYNVRQTIWVESTEVAKIEQLTNSIQKLLDQGVVLEYESTEYYYTKLAELRPELFADATKDAQQRASAIARGTGARVGKARSARTGVIQILPPNSTDVADYGAYDLSTKEKEITATVSVGFELK